MAVVVVVVPPICAYRHDCGHVSATEAVFIVVGTVLAVAVTYGLIALGVWLSELWSEHRRRW